MKYIKYIQEFKKNLHDLNAKCGKFLYKLFHTLDKFYHFFLYQFCSICDGREEPSLAHTLLIDNRNPLVIINFGILSTFHEHFFMGIILQ